MLDALRALFRPKLLQAVRNADAGDYRVYNSSFDRIIAARDLAGVIGPLPEKYGTVLDDAWTELQIGLLPWKLRLMVEASEIASDIRNLIEADKLKDTVIAILLDQSGSMRGQKMLFAAASVEIVLEFLKVLGTAVEILGFTTSAWKGGKSRQAWLANGRPANPGRMNDLLHVVYYDAEQASGTGYGLKHMLRPDLLKENIDGEAIEWAADRLRQRSEKRKLLVVVSDGAPVDDATLTYNSANYLQKHLLSVIDQINRAGDIDLSAIGLEHRVETWYRHSAFCETPDALGGSMLTLLQERILAERQRAPE